MKSTQILPFILVAAIFGAGGYFLGRQADPPAAGTPANNADARKPLPALAPSGTGRALPDSLTRLLGNEPITAANASTLMFRALEESDPATRMAATTFLLESMTPENAIAIRQAFLDITTQSGRRSDTEWALMVRRCGTVLGAEALKTFASDKHNLALAVEGFASVDPDGTMAAIKAAGIEGKTLTNAWLTGVCRKDPQKALALALSGKHADINSGGLLNEAIQTAGVEGAREAMQRALDADPDNAPSSDAFPGLFKALAEALLHKHITNNTPGEMQKWVEQQKGQPHITDDLIGRVTYETLLKGNPPETIEWLGRMNAGNDGPPVGAARIFDALVTNPKIVSSLDDASFSRLLPMIEKDPIRIETLAAIVEGANPARAKQIRALMPLPAIPVPSTPAPQGVQ